MNRPRQEHPQSRWVFRQFALPHGVLGWLAGIIMARGNADMARITIDLLRPLPTDRVLEIGFGPGIGIQMLAHGMPDGFVAGVDPSQVMFDQACRRNHRAIAAGRVELRVGSSEHIPWPDRSFSAACSINNVMLWNLPAGAPEVRRVLRDGGRLVVAVHEWTLGGERGAFLRLGAAFPSLGNVVKALEHAGFDVRDVRRLATRSGPGVFVVARAL